MTPEQLSCKHPKQALLSPEELEAHLSAAEAWRLEDGALIRELHFEEVADAFAYLTQVAQVAADLNHHPRVRWFKRDVTLRLFTRKSGGLTARDFALARACDEALP